MKKVIIVGGGLFGSIAAHLALKKGAEVMVVDPFEGNSASSAAACLIKPSWLSSLSKDQIKVGYEVLNGLYRVETLKFGNGLKQIDIDWVPPYLILDGHHEVQYVEKYAIKVGDGVVVLSNGVELKGKVLVAAGVCCEGLVSMPPVKALMGLSLLFEGTMSSELVVYAPYKQAVAFNISPDVIWFGNGGSIIKKNWDTGKQLEKALKQAGNFFGLERETLLSYNYGGRPYVEGHKAGYFAKVYSNTWVSTGGAKNGTVLAAYQAWRFIEEAL